MSASRTIPSRSPTITPHIETVCANNTRICPTNSDKRASSPLYPGSMASNSISVSVNLNAALDTAESNYLPLQNLCQRGDFLGVRLVVEGRGTKRQSDSFSGNKAGFVLLGRPRKNSVSPQGAKVTEANVS